MAKLVLIEDSKNLAIALKGALELYGHEVIWISDGREALMAVKNNRRRLPLLFVCCHNR